MVNRYPGYTKTGMLREMEGTDFDNIVDYFLQAGKDFLLRVGVDMYKLLQRKEWLRLLYNEYRQSVENKKLYCVIGLINNVALGHSHINHK